MEYLSQSSHDGFSRGAWPTIVCPFCGYEDEFAGLDLLDGYMVDWMPCCLSAQEEVARFGFEAVFGVSAEKVISELSGLPIREVVLEGDSGDSVARCRLSAHDPGEGVPGWQTEVFEDVDQHHRHHPAPQGWKFGVAVYNGRTKVGVAVVGRPVSRALQEQEPGTLEVTRVCTWGESALRRNAATKLYGLAAKRARKLGYTALITYTLADECGSSLKAAGFVPEARVKARKSGWDCKGRRREVKAPTGEKIRWRRVIS